MVPNIISITILLSILYLASFPPLTKGLTAPLIPPLSPESPFYTEVLKANNIILSNYENITLDRNHYMTWLFSKLSASQNEFGETYYTKGEHVIRLNLGDPIQSMYGLFDTGSSLTWFKCETGLEDPAYSYYNYTLSGSYRIVGCNDTEKCNTNKIPAIKGCNIAQACVFDSLYAEGSWAKGVLSTDHLTFNIKYKKMLVLFRFGCSLNDTTKLTGVVGGSNSEYSLPRQLYVDDPKFSYCISSDLSKINVIAFGPDAKIQGQRVNMLKNLQNYYYYMDVVGLTVNKERIDVSPEVFQMSASWSRGFIIDSGTASTQLSELAFDALEKRLAQLFGPPTQYNIEGDVQFEICYDRAMFVKGRPVIGVDFTNSSFEIDESNIWFKVPDSYLECLIVINGKSDTISILGNLQLHDVNVGYDPNNGALYFDKIRCPNL